MYQVFNKVKNSRRQYFDFILISCPTKEIVVERFKEEYNTAKIVARFEKIKDNLEEYINYENLDYNPDKSKKDEKKQQRIMNKFRRDICYLERFGFNFFEFKAMTIAEENHHCNKVYETKDRKIIVTDKYTKVIKKYSSYHSMKALEILKVYLSEITFFIKMKFLY